MSSLFHWKKNLNITEKEPVYKVRYLGNVQTSMMKGDGCVDKPVSIIWNNYLRNSNPGLQMKLKVTSSGLNASTKEQGLTEYRAHRISYCIAHPHYSKLFVWVYRHEGKRMRCELRCHAVLCKSEALAKALTVHLHEKLDLALKEFKREKTRMQNSRLTLQRAKSLPHAGSTTSSSSSVLPLRKQMLSTGQNFKPSVSKSNTAPKLGAITEDTEFEEEEEEEEEEEDFLSELPAEDYDFRANVNRSGMDTLSDKFPDFTLGDSQRIIDIEIGNDINELKTDSEVSLCMNRTDSDEESSESGFHEQDTKEVLSATDVDDLSCDAEVCEVPLGSHLNGLTLSSRDTNFLGASHPLNSEDVTFL